MQYLTLKPDANRENANYWLEKGHYMGKQVGWGKFARMIVDQNLDKCQTLFPRGRKLGNRRQRRKRVKREIQFMLLDALKMHFDWKNFENLPEQFFVKTKDGVVSVEGETLVLTHPRKIW